MRRTIGLFFSLTLTALGACQSQSGAPSLDTDDQKASYGIGRQMGSQLAPAESHIDLEAFLAGVRDGMAGNDPALPQDEIQAALQSLNETRFSTDAEASGGSYSNPYTPPAVSTTCVTAPNVSFQWSRITLPLKSRISRSLPRIVLRPK